ncbi:RNA polymerase sigma factor SigJ [Chitinivorax sp. PXF-14]|uniref:RNA polymerase sigma factor SigJ n=1 Tax=Chitinivorax sp. PXF-14 TaxID=3230488 RepID=UPI00346752AE
MRLDAATERFMRHRPMLRRLAYRMLGEPGQADDMVQEAWLRWHGADLAAIANDQAWLVTTLSRLCLDRLRELKRERERYVGPWLPEPSDEADSAADPAQVLARGSDIGMALLLLLEQLSPEERVAFLMQQVFEHDYRHIAAVLGKREAACRQLVSRARKQLAAGQGVRETDGAVRAYLLAAFVGALASGDISALLATLAPDVVLISDGGGHVSAASKPVYGQRAVSRLLHGLARLQAATAQVEMRIVNGEPALVGLRDGLVYFVMAFDIGTSGLRRILTLNNPFRLQRLQAAA